MSVRTPVDRTEALNVVEECLILVGKKPRQSELRVLVLSVQRLRLCSDGSKQVRNVQVLPLSEMRFGKQTFERPARPQAGRQAGRQAAQAGSAGRQAAATARLTSRA